MYQLKNIKAVIFDWAGTIVDYGCMAPTQVFIDVFAGKDIYLSKDEARGPMGLAKKDHVRELFRLDNVQKQWFAEYGKFPNEEDVTELYSQLEPALTKIVEKYSEPITGAVELIESLKDQGIKVGSTTGYVAEMMNAILPIASVHGLQPDAVVNSSDVSSGRPFPWMIYRNCEIMNIFPLNRMVKIGDTVADIHEGKNAGMWTIGLSKSGNEVGLSLQETESADPAWLTEKIAIAKEKLLNAGADFVIEGVWDCWPVLEEIDRQIGIRINRDAV